MGARIATGALVLLLSAGLLLGAVASPVLAGDGGAAIAKKKKCKKKKGKKKKKKCKKKQSSSGSSSASPASLLVTPGGMSYSTIGIGSTTNPTTFTVTNIGGQASGGLSEVLGGGDAGEFVLQNDNCAASSLNGNESCTFQVAFRPTTVGDKGASVTVSSSSGAGSLVTLSGTGAQPGVLSVSPVSHNFGAAVANGTSPAPQVFTITNNGGLATGGLVVAFSGASRSSYTLTADSCSTVSLGSGQSCTVTVTFKPPSACSPCDASLDVSGPTATAASAMLTGTATGIAISPASFNYGATAPGSPISHTFTITNNTAAPTGLTFSGPTISGSDPGDYSIANNLCLVALTPSPAPGSTCTFDVVFNPVNTPTPNRASSAAVSISTTPGGTASAPLSGIET
jgi:hypothetical protein